MFFSFTNNKKSLFFTFSIILLNILFFFLIGQRGYIEMRDTASYCQPNLTEGIMPIYPFLINICRLIFGDYCLDAVAAIQGSLATIIITTFILFLKKIFELRYWECYLLWMAAVLPFAIELPKYVLTHVIYTEGIAYSFFYVFAMAALNTLLNPIWKKWFVLTVMIAILMGLMRPQLMLMLILCSVLLIYKLLAGKKSRWSLNVGIGVALSILLVFCGAIGIFKIRALYISTIGSWFEQRFEADGEIELAIEKNVEKESVAEKQIQPADTEASAAETEPKQGASLGQVGSALICRAFYEAEAEDYQYYKDIDMQEMFSRIYAECDKQQILYPYAKKGLWMWEDLTQTEIYHIASREIGDYLREKYPEIDNNDLQQKITQIKISIALTELRLHFGRFLYHCFRLMIPGFISCIFFNIEAIYLLCHIVVLFLYMSAFLMALYVLRCKRTGSDAAQFMLAALLSCIVFVGVVNAVFFGMQRYFIYNMGIFYCAYYMVFRAVFMDVVQKYEKRIRK